MVVESGDGGWWVVGGSGWVTVTGGSEWGVVSGDGGWWVAGGDGWVVVVVVGRGGSDEEWVVVASGWQLEENGVPNATIWDSINAERRAQAYVWTGRSCAQEHRCLQTALYHHQNFSRSQWYEQDGYQSLDKLFITNDAATIVNELEVQHPAAKILVLAGKAQQEEIGDGANLTVSFAGELLQNAEELIRMGLHPSEIIIGYTKAINKTIEILDELVAKGSEKMDVRNKDEVIKRMKAAVASKQFGLEDILCPLIAEACIQVCPKNPANFNVDNVRVARLLGGGLHNCTIVRVMVAVFVGGVDTSATETKGTILIHSAEQPGCGVAAGNKKNTAAKESGHHWNSALFSDRERQEKFNKLMGVKGDVKVEQKPDNQESSSLLQAEKQRELQLDLEKQYTAGLLGSDILRP
ncbi:hypothetical protein TEA_022935 [Camellia sinensis var. sinensis]|uniref:Small acidic protein-like domain-containing protein n=1 Tax=Camellia sinensis var. sinensis TaxID=542762 RepID=A0A4S4DKW6_CAMSN|nr:hypothetical protein TEA_022935 [Camellia sinensis var. sinensis]